MFVFSTNLFIELLFSGHAKRANALALFLFHKVGKKHGTAKFFAGNIFIKENWTYTAHPARLAHTQAKNVIGRKRGIEGGTHKSILSFLMIQLHQKP